MGKKPSYASTRSMRLQQLQNEIDNLALLVNEAKRQSDKIQAAADALGDDLLVDLEPGILPENGSDRRNRLRKSE